MRDEEANGTELKVSKRDVKVIFFNPSKYSAESYDNVSLC